MASLAGKTLFITGASRGIGLAIALRAARDGANIVIAAKSGVPNPKLPGTIHTAAAAVEAAGGKALALQVDIRDEAQVRDAAAQAADAFRRHRHRGQQRQRHLAGRRRGNADEAFRPDAAGQHARHFSGHPGCLPYLKQAANPHVLMLSPPPSLEPQMVCAAHRLHHRQMGMSLCVLGMSGEFRRLGIAVNALWPRTVIATAAIAMIEGVSAGSCRKPDDRGRCRPCDADPSGA